MKYIIASMLVMVLASFASADWDDYDDRPCSLDTDCKRSDCCVEDPRSTSGHRSCQDRGDDRWDACGGPHFCPCRYGLVCVPHASQPARLTRGFAHLSNGTCQPDPAIYPNVDANNVGRARRPYRGRHGSSESHESLEDLFDDWSD